jgi:hypothetical protein
MTYITEDYMSVTAFLCKSPYEPSALCHPKICSEPSMSTREKDIMGLIQDVEVTAYIKTEETEDYEISAALLKEGEEVSSVLVHPVCADIGVDSSIRWYREGDDITAELPLINICGVEKFKTEYSENITAYTLPENKGEISGKNPEFTYERDGRLIHQTDLNKKYLVPGEEVSVSYKVEGFGDFYEFAKFRFETDIFTSAVVKGCGLVERIKVLNNPNNPEEGYHYEYSPVEGGIGYGIKPEWLYDTRLRWAVEFADKIYWLRPISGADYKTDKRAAIAKSLSALPLHPDTELTSSMANDTLSETSDFIVPEYFYSKL